MITIPTYELVGMIGDMLPFVDADKDSVATHCIRVEQKGDQLTMLATNRSQAMRVTWTPEDGREGDSEDVWRRISASDGFDVRITPTDAKAIVSTFKLPGKLDYAPVTLSSQLLSLEDGLQSLKIARVAVEDEWSSLTMLVTGRGAPNVDSGDQPEIDIHGLINSQAGEEEAEAMLTRISLHPKLLANLGKVERHGAMTFVYRSSRDGAPFYVKAGERFDGVMFPVKVTREATFVSATGVTLGVNQ